MADLNELATYQSRLKRKCSLAIQYDSRMESWAATVATQANDYPHWQQADAATPEEAWGKLRRFLDGGPQLHGRRLISGADFLATAKEA